MGILLRMVELMRILRNIADDDHTAIYDLKLRLIENCIYGGDIQSIAVQISKLRFFISLVCEQKPTADPKKNYGINTLPNLETKFVAADSLIGLPRSGEMLPMANVEKLKKDLWEVRHKHFLARTYQEKKDLRKEDKKLRTELAKALQAGGGFDTASAKLMAEWDPYDQNTSASFSDPEWMFNVKDGFDIVIGNPPYGVSFDESIRDKLKREFVTYTLRGESYVLFIEQGILLLSKCGRLAYIVPDTYLNLGFTLPLRELLLTKTKISKIISLPAKVFEAAVVDTTLLFTTNRIEQDKTLSYNIRVNRHSKTAGDFDISRPIADFDIVAATWHRQRIFNIQSGSSESDLIDRIDSKCSTLANYAEVLSGIKAYEVGKGTPAQTAKVRETKPFTGRLMKDSSWSPFLEGKHIVRYGNLWNEDNWIKYGNWLAAPRDKIRFLGAKLLVRKIVDNRLIGTYVSGETYCNTLLFVIKCKHINDNMGEKPLLAIICSGFIGWYFRKRFQISSSDTFPQIMARDIMQFPIPNMRRGIKESLESLVDRILAAKKADPAADTSAWEAEIDRLVYQLYGLTEEEIAIVEGSVAAKATDKKRKTKPAADDEEAEEDEPAAKHPAAPSKKPAPRKLKPNLPPSLPGWD